MYRLLLALLLLGSTAHAALSPLSVAVWPPVQFPPDNFDITGARISLLQGRHRSVFGIDLGVVGNVTEVNFVGLALAGGYNITHGTATILGLQAAGGANINTQKTHVYGAQVAIIGNFNSAESSITGLNFALINHSPHTSVYGVQAGIYNQAQTVYGLQIGVINVTDNLHGLQIGLLNFNHTGIFVVAPILNVGF